MLYLLWPKELQLSYLQPPDLQADVLQVALEVHASARGCKRCGTLRHTLLKRCMQATLTGVHSEYSRGQVLTFQIRRDQGLHPLS